MKTRIILVWYNVGMRKAACDVGGCRPLVEIVRENHHTVWVRLDPREPDLKYIPTHYQVVRRKGIIKRHKRKHHVSIVGD